MDKPNCGYCGLPVDMNEPGIRYIGSSVQHRSPRCAELLHEKIAAMTKAKEEAERKVKALLPVLEALKSHGAHKQNCAILTIRPTDPPLRNPCDCGLHAALAAAKE